MGPRLREPRVSVPGSVSADCWPGLALFLLLCLPAVAGAAEEVRVEASRAGTAVAVNARANLNAPLAIIWNTLTDYEHLPEFIPGMKRSRIIGRRGPAAIVEQDGEAGFLVFRVPIHVVVESAEYPPNLITIHVVRGNLRQLEGRYHIEQGASAQEHILRWSGLIEADTVLPAFITVPLMRANIEDQFTGMVREIERRYEARQKADTQAIDK